MKTQRNPITAAAAALCMACAAPAQSAPIADMVHAWNRGDTLAAQQNFKRANNTARAQAELALLAESGARIRGLVQITPKAWALKIGDYTAIIDECPESPQWCWFDYRAVQTVGGAERGQLADIASTLVGLSAGLGEGNPAGFAVIPWKAYWIARSRSSEINYNDCLGLRHGLDIFGYAPAAMNIPTIAGAPFGVGAGIFAAAVFARWQPALEQAMFECAELKLQQAEAA